MLRLFIVAPLSIHCTIAYILNAFGLVLHPNVCVSCWQDSCPYTIFGRYSISTPMLTGAFSEIVALKGIEYGADFVIIPLVAS